MAVAKAEADAMRMKANAITTQVIDYEKATRTQGFDGVDSLVIGQGANLIKTVN